MDIKQIWHRGNLFFFCSAYFLNEFLSHIYTLCMVEDPILLRGDLCLSDWANHNTPYFSSHNDWSRVGHMTQTSPEDHTRFFYLKTIGKSPETSCHCDSQQMNKVHVNKDRIKPNTDRHKRYKWDREELNPTNFILISRTQSPRGDMISVLPL